MAGNRKINNEEQLASVRAKLNDNFDDLSNVTTQLQPLTAITGGGSDGFMRANADGTFDTIKTAPPDGGIGDNNRIQEMSNFAGKIPDAILVSSATGNIQQATFYSITDDDKIQYKLWSDNSFYCEFDNDDIGRNATMKGSASSWSFLNGATTLQDVIDNGNAVFHGQKSGTGGSGSLNLVKTLVNKSGNGGFYTELPDVIYVEITSTDPDYFGAFYLDLVKPNASAGTGANVSWEAIYRPTQLEKSIRFNLDENGTLQSQTGFGNTLPTNTATKNLRWYIESGRAVYFGGQQDYGVKAWGKFDGTGSNGQLTFSGGNVSSVEKISDGKYKVTFANPLPHADYAVTGSVNPTGFDGAYFAHRNFGTEVPTTQSFYIEVRAVQTNGAFSNSDHISFQVVC